MERATPPGLRVPPLVGTIIGAAVAAGPIIGATSRRAPPALRAVRSVFWSAALGYLTTSLVDFVEHFRLEKQATGHYLRSAVVPVGETLNHAATIGTVVSALALARPVRARRLRARLVVIGRAGAVSRSAGATNSCTTGGARRTART